jgi:hypothetical protein
MIAKALQDKALRSGGLYHPTTIYMPIAGEG